jgi:hypothetical protein
MKESLNGLFQWPQIEAVAPFINSHSFESLDFRMPVGGVKQSGIGREFTEKGLEGYVEKGIFSLWRSFRKMRIYNVKYENVHFSILILRNGGFSILH